MPALVAALRAPWGTMRIEPHWRAPPLWDTLDTGMLRIAFDLDGVLADFSGAYVATAEGSLARTDRANAAGNAGVTAAVTTGEAGVSAAATDENVSANRAGAWAGPSPRLQARVWRTIRAVPDFWTTLQPLEPGVIRRIHRMALSG